MLRGKGAEEARRAADRQKAAVLDGIALPVAQLDSKLRILWANRSAAEWANLNPEQLLNRHCYEVWQRRNAPCESCPVLTALETGWPNEGEVSIRGGKTWHMAANPIAKDSGRITGVVLVATETTGQRQTAEELRVTRERLDLLLKGMDLGTWEWNVQSGGTVFSERWTAMLGYRPDQLRPHISTWEQLLHPNDRPRVKEQLRAYAEGRTPSYETVYRMRAKSGEWKWFLVRKVVAARDNTGKPLRITGFHLDITQYKRAENERACLFDLSIDMLCVVGFDGHFRQLNPAWTRVLGWTEEELKNRPWHQLVHPDDRPKAMSAGEQLQNGKPVLHFENRYRCRDGSYRWFAWTASPLMNEQLIVAVVRDTTARKRNEMALRQSEERLRLLVESAEDIIVLHDAQGRYLYYNGPSRYGMKSSDVQGKRPSDIFPKAEAARIMEEIKEAVSSGKITTVENTYTLQGETLWFSDQTVPIRDAAGRVTAVAKFCRNITDRKKAEEALRLHNAGLEKLVQLCHMVHAPDDQLTQFVLEEAVALTASAFGFMVFLDENGDLSEPQIWTKGTMEMCKVSTPPAHLPVGQAGVWAEAVRQRKPAIINDYAASDHAKKGCPEGHVPLKRLISVPALDGGKVVAVIAVANKETDYDEADVNLLTLFGEGLWNHMKAARARQEANQKQ